LEKELILVQKSSLSDNGPGPLPKGFQDGSAQYPVTFVRKEKFEEILNRNYSIDLMINEDKGTDKAAVPSIDMYGYFGSLK
jgi:hypothetical protein